MTINENGIISRYYMLCNFFNSIPLHRSKDTWLLDYKQSCVNKNNINYNKNQRVYLPSPTTSIF
jgi:hypothetical protein